MKPPKHIADEISLKASAEYRKPYYDDGHGIIIYHGDNREILPTLGKFDLCLTDPPYGLGKKLTGGNWGERVGKAAEWDILHSDIEQIVIACSKDTICFGGNYYPLPPSRCWLGWIKRDAVRTCANLELAWTSFDACSKYFDYTIAATNKERCEHPTIKPLALIKWALAIARGISTIKTVIDPFMGSGTTLRAAKDLGLHCIGIEREEQYCEIAVRRLQQEILCI